MYPTISKMFDDAVAAHGERIALRMPIPKERKRGRGVKLVLNEISYERLGEMVGRFSTALSELGVSAGDRVAIIAKPRAAWMTSFFSILRCAAVVLPLDPELQKGEVQRILTEAEVKGVITSGEKAEDLAELKTGALEKMFVISMDRAKSERVLFLDALLLGKSPLPRVEVDPSSLAVLMYTSGTTGNSKGAMLSHANITSNALTAMKVGSSIARATPTRSSIFMSDLPWAIV